MINEVYETQQYLDGDNIITTNLYRICYLIACYYKERGLKKIEIREALFEWGKQYHVFIKYNVNDIINRVFATERAKLLRNPVVKINKQDIAEIKKRFDDNKTRLVALAMLCFAKAHGTKDGEFSISSVGLGAWLNISRKTLRSKYIKELIEYEFLSEVEKPQNNMRWDKSYDTQSTQYRINHPLHNSGNVTLFNNDMKQLFSEVF